MLFETECYFVAAIRCNGLIVEMMLIFACALMNLYYRIERIFVYNEKEGIRIKGCLIASIGVLESL